MSTSRGTPEGAQDISGYHEYPGPTMMNVEGGMWGCSVHWGFNYKFSGFINDLLTLIMVSPLHSRVLNTPSEFMISAKCTEQSPVYCTAPGILHTQYATQSSDVLQHSQNRPTGDKWLKL